MSFDSADIDTEVERHNRVVEALMRKANHRNKIVNPEGRETNYMNLFQDDDIVCSNDQQSNDLSIADVEKERIAREDKSKQQTSSCLAVDDSRGTNNLAKLRTKATVCNSDEKPKQLNPPKVVAETKKAKIAQENKKMRIENKSEGSISFPKFRHAKQTSSGLAVDDSRGTNNLAKLRTKATVCNSDEKPKQLNPPKVVAETKKAKIAREDKIVKIEHKSDCVPARERVRSSFPLDNVQTPQIDEPLDLSLSSGRGYSNKRRRKSQPYSEMDEPLDLSFSTGSISHPSFFSARQTSSSLAVGGSRGTAHLTGFDVPAYFRKLAREDKKVNNSRARQTSSCLSMDDSRRNITRDLFQDDDIFCRNVKNSNNLNPPKTIAEIEKAKLAREDKKVNNSRARQTSSCLSMDDSRRNITMDLFQDDDIFCRNVKNSNNLNPPKTIAEIEKAKLAREDKKVNNSRARQTSSCLSMDDSRRNITMDLFQDDDIFCRNVKNSNNLNPPKTIAEIEKAKLAREDKKVNNSRARQTSSCLSMDDRRRNITRDLFQDDDIFCRNVKNSNNLNPPKTIAEIEKAKLAREDKKVNNSRARQTSSCLSMDDSRRNITMDLFQDDDIFCRNVKNSNNLNPPKTIAEIEKAKLAREDKKVNNSRARQTSSCLSMDDSRRNITRDLFQDDDIFCRNVKNSNNLNPPKTIAEIEKAKLAREDKKVNNSRARQTSSCLSMDDSRRNITMDLFQDDDIFCRIVKKSNNLNPPKTIAEIEKAKIVGENKSAKIESESESSISFPIFCHDKRTSSCLAVDDSRGTTKLAKLRIKDKVCISDEKSKQLNPLKAVEETKKAKIARENKSKQQTSSCLAVDDSRGTTNLVKLRTKVKVYISDEKPKQLNPLKAVAETKKAKIKATGKENESKKKEDGTPTFSTKQEELDHIFDRLLREDNNIGVPAFVGKRKK